MILGIQLLSKTMNCVPRISTWSGMKTVTFFVVEKLLRLKSFFFSITAQWLSVLSSKLLQEDFLILPSFCNIYLGSFQPSCKLKSKSLPYSK